ncbi:MAG: SPFH domain-containing protein [Planctomycetota bacterium]|nr:SPFH domain-containing protein [Planctomycetota bacterium]
MEFRQPTSPQLLPSGPGHHPDTIAMGGLIIQVLVSSFAFGVYIYSGYKDEFRIGGSAAIIGEICHLLPGIAVWLVCYLRLRLNRIADAEDREIEILKGRADGSSSLFEASQTPDAYTARGRLLRFEKSFIPATTVVSALFMLLVGSAILFKWVYLPSGVITERLAVCGAFLFSFAFVAFAFSQYVVGLSSVHEYRHLRPAGAFMLSNSLLLSLCGLSMWLSIAEVTLLDTVLRHALPILVVLLGIEFILNFILDFFRPRLPGQELRPPYESRLFGLFAQPGSLWNAVAETLDYQFGFKVSRTWFFKFIAQLILPLIAFQLVSAVLLTSIVVVKHDELVIVERFGKPAGDILQPGFHLKIPWPIERAYPLPTGIQRVVVGIEEAERNSEAELKTGQLPSNVVVWTQPRQLASDYILLASQTTSEVRETTEEQPEVGTSVPVNVLNVSLILHYRISDKREELFDYFYHQTDAQRYLVSIAFRELVQVCCSVKMEDLMGPARLTLAARIQTRIMEQAKTSRLGLEVIAVGFQLVHPPLPVADTFESIVESQEKRLTSIVEAEAFAARTVPGAKTTGRVRVHEAESYKTRRVSIAKAEADSFKHQRNAYELATPEIYELRYFLSTLEEALKGKRKLVIPKNMKNQVIELNLEEKLNADLLNVDLGE